MSCTSLTVASTVACDVLSPGITSIIGIMCGGFDQCMPTTRSGFCRFAAIFVIGMPDVFRARSGCGGGGGRVGGAGLLELGEQLLLELELLGRRLDHQLAAGERGREIGLVG